MTTTVTSFSYQIAAAGGGTFQYGIFNVLDSTTGKTVGYPGHFVLNAAAAAVNPATDDTQLLVLAQLEAIAAKAIVLTDAFGNSTENATDIFGSPID